jgi:hypothetical protein
MKVSEIKEALNNYEDDDELVALWWGNDEFEDIDPDKWPEVAQAAQEGRMFEYVAQHASEIIQRIADET